MKHVKLISATCENNITAIKIYHAKKVTKICINSLFSIMLWITFLTTNFIIVEVVN